MRAAMPGFIAKKLCPQLVIVPPNMDKYAAVAEQVRFFCHFPSEYLVTFCFGSGEGGVQGIRS